MCVLARLVGFSLRCHAVTVRRVRTGYAGYARFLRFVGVAMGARSLVPHRKQANDLLRQARLSGSSPSSGGRPMSRGELAEAVTAYVRSRHGYQAALDAGYVGRLERGDHRWPRDLYREAFRVVLGVTTDADLGFYIIPARAGD